jgi:hypothetical protein
MSRAVHALLDHNGIDIQWFTSAGGRIEAETEERRATMIASAGPAAGGGGRGEAVYSSGKD